jgi:CheY-like chemotaxis protein
MPTKILLIENDAALASRLTGALEAEGFEPRVAPDGREGLEAAREWAPRAIVLCVELPGMSGYLVCQKLRKDDAVSSIPLVLTSAEATEATFENHRKLKVRADAYLLKPFAPGALLEALAGIGVAGAPDAFAPGPADAGEEEEIVHLEELPIEPVDDLPALDLSKLPHASSSPPPVPASLDDDLRRFEDAFEGLSTPEHGLTLAPPNGAVAPGLDGTALDAPLTGSLLLQAPESAVASLAAELRGLDAADGTRPGPREDDGDPAAQAASADLLGAAAIPLAADDDLTRSTPLAPPAEARGAGRLERELAEARVALADVRAVAESRAAELADMRARADDAERRAGEAARRTEEAERRAGEEAWRAEQAERRAGDLARRAENAEQRAADAARRADEAERGAGDAALRGDDAERRAREASRRADEAAAEGARSREALEAAAARARELEAALADARRRGDEVTRRAEEAEASLRRAEEGLVRAEALEDEMEGLRTELLVAHGEVEGARAEVEKRSAELDGRIAELEALVARHEERVVRAYQKIRADEKVREKVRKAVAIAGQLLDDGVAPDPGVQGAPERTAPFGRG